MWKYCELYGKTWQWAETCWTTQKDTEKQENTENKENTETQKNTENTGKHRKFNDNSMNQIIQRSNNDLSLVKFYNELDLVQTRVDIHLLPPQYLWPEIL